MKWIEAAITTRSEEIDALCEKLGAYDIGGICIEDEADFKRFLENNHQYWDYVDDALAAHYDGLSRVKFYVEDSDAGRALLEKIKAELGCEVATSTVDDADWENSWQQYYEPLEIGEKLLVIPEWLDAEPNGRTVLRLDPGIAFGTGSHPTTRMCLEALERFAAPGKTALDLGCGSGILGIAALLLGCEKVLGCDVDPKSPDAAMANAALNGIGADRLKLYAGDLLRDEGMRRELDGSYDIVLANIVADVIVALAAFVRRYLKPGGAFICSGIIDGREDEVRAALTGAGLAVEDHLHEDEWHCFVCKA